MEGANKLDFRPSVPYAVTPAAVTAALVRIAPIIFSAECVVTSQEHRFQLASRFAFTGATSLPSTSIEIDFVIISTEITRRVQFFTFFNMPTIPKRGPSWMICTCWPVLKYGNGLGSVPVLTNFRNVAISSSAIAHNFPPKLTILFTAQIERMARVRERLLRQKMYPGNNGWVIVLILSDHCRFDL
jgi:hypothetical protein